MRTWSPSTQASFWMIFSVRAREPGPWNSVEANGA